MQVGRAIYEFCVSMIITCGEAFVMAVKYRGMDVTEVGVCDELRSTASDVGTVSGRQLSVVIQ